MSPRRLSRIPLVTACLLLAGCLNDSDTLVDAGSDPTPDLNPPAQVPPPTRSAGPSVQGLDRRNWDVVQVAAPRGQVQHQPTYAEPLVFNGGDARNGKTFPTTSDAMTLGAPVDAAASEGALEAGWPAVLLVVAPARMVLGMPPWLTMQGPAQADGVLPAAQRDGAPGLWAWVSSEGSVKP
jgi:hypothetical protein